MTDETNEEERQSEELDVRGIVWTWKVLVKWAGAITTVGGLCYVLVTAGMTYMDWKKTIADHGRHITALKAQVKTLEGERGKCESKARSMLDTAKDEIQKRFRQDEKTLLELQGAVLALRTEVRIRAQDREYIALVRNAIVHSKTEEAKAPPSRMPTNREVLNVATKDADKAVLRSIVSHPDDDPLSSLSF